MSTLRVRAEIPMHLTHTHTHTQVQCPFVSMLGEEQGGCVLERWHNV